MTLYFKSPLKSTCREELGQASGTKRATSCVLVCETPRKRKPAADGSVEKEDSKDWKEGWEDLLKEVGELVRFDTSAYLWCDLDQTLQVADLAQESF